MTGDERWYEAVKLIQKAAELLEGEMVESVIKGKDGELQQLTITFDNTKLNDHDNARQAGE